MIDETFIARWGSLCLDFANTARWHASERPEETLHNYSDLVQWAQRAGVVSGQDADRLLREAVSRPGEAAAALARAIALRENIYRIFVAVIRKDAPGEDDILNLNVVLSRAMAGAHIVRTSDGFAWGWDADEDTLDLILWPIARSAAELLTSDERGRVGQCADDRGCGWLFLDTSKNHSRRWCNMQDCGNRAKAHRYYQRGVHT